MSDLEIIEELIREGIPLEKLSNTSFENYKSNKNGFVVVENKIIKLRIKDTILSLKASESMFNLIHLTDLILSKNKLKNISSSILKLKNLNCLYITFNQLNIISLDILKLENLKILNLSNNGIKKIPNEISNLINLEELYLVANIIYKIPLQVLELKNLKKLNISNNKIDLIPDTINKLINLKVLNLFRNKITKLPFNVFHLNSLDKLDLNTNNIKKLPNQIQENQINLKKINLKYNPITDNLKELDKLKPKEFIRYILTIQDKESNPLNEAKILVLGDERVGKTSIINRLVKNEFNTEQGSTQGIDIQNHYLSNGIKANIWDFAGQEITHQTHQFFLSTRSLYLFVLDAQKEDNDSAIYDWLEVIKSNGGDSPVIIVANKYDLNRGYNFDANRYKKDFPNIIDIINVSAQENINIDTLIESVEKHISELDHVKDVLPKDWLEVKKTLEQLSNEEADYIEGGKFDEICEENNIDEELDQQTLLTILHEIGTVVRYENSKLNRFQIINPLWVTNAVYKIIRSEFLNEDAILHKKTFSKIFRDDKRYKAKHYQWIMDLLVQFELAFRLDENRVLIPSKLPNNEPDFDITPFQQGLNLRYRYEGRLKKSFISQFMVKMSDEIDMSLETPYWQRGVFLNYANCKAVVISEEEKKTITISIDTENIQGREFLSNIRREFKKINKSIEVEEEVPLILDEQIVGFADYENLVLAEEEGDTHFRFKVKVDGESKSHKFKISDLLYGYEMLDEGEIVDTKPLIITESKTDWKHLKKALERFQKDGLYQGLSIQFMEYGDEIDMGEDNLNHMLKANIKKEPVEQQIFIFDRDTKHKDIKKYQQVESTKHSEKVYSLCIPKINDLDGICIEFYYEENDLITEDKNGRRLFLGKEFLPKANGNSKCGKFQTREINKAGKVLEIIDNAVYYREDFEMKNSIALKKDDFAENILNNVEGFDNFDIEYFKLIFDVIEKIVNEK